ncbi:unnamed protein product [Cylicostephanus goldi]|uniref:Uncharacterized protein n=1 Tax=Cylicostephanus goldi TaxID=71465 RepID=A0A3P6S5S6_CYLGO|nr:unnamed protein product [Cylicostephanus goldi]
MAAFEDVTYVKLFSELKIRYEQQRDREKAANAVKDERVPSPAAFAKERQEEQWFDGDEDETEVKKEAAEKKEAKRDDTPRKTGIEPMFPSVLKRKNAFDEDDGAVFSGQPTTPLAPVNAQSEKKIVIKMNDRSRTPSPLGSPCSSTSVSPTPQARDDEVSSSQNHSKENSPSMSIKSLVDYDESDSDEDENSAPNDALPSSSTGSPVPAQLGSTTETDGSAGSETTKIAPAPPSGDLSPCDDDVSSTSGEEETTAAGGGDMFVRRKRPSNSDFDEDLAKRSRASPTTET